jgi:hypothetical protein
MADDPVGCEPVSGRKFPANREINREFYENRAVWRKIACKNAAESVSCRTIPYKMKQGINSRRTRNLLRRAGNLLRFAGNCPPVSRSFFHRGYGHGLILSCSSEFESPQPRLVFLVPPIAGIVALFPRVSFLTMLPSPTRDAKRPGAGLKRPPGLSRPFSSRGM